MYRLLSETFPVSALSLLSSVMNTLYTLYTMASFDVLYIGTELYLAFNPKWPAPFWFTSLFITPKTTPEIDLNCKQ